MNDEIITEVWKVKDAIAREYGCNVKSFVAHLRAQKHNSEIQVVDLRAMKLAAEQKNAADGESVGA